MSNLSRAQKIISGNKGLLFLRLTFLLNFGLWLYSLYTPNDGLFELACDVVVSVFVSAFTFEWVALALVMLFFPLLIAIKIIRGQ